MTETQATDPYEAADHAAELRGVAHSAEAALTDEEIDSLVMAANHIEAAAGIQTGEIVRTSRTTGQTYRVTKWVDSGEGIIALEKEALEE